jgi:hypothetical protein
VGDEIAGEESDTMLSSVGGEEGTEGIRVDLDLRRRGREVDDERGSREEDETDAAVAERLDFDRVKTPFDAPLERTEGVHILRSLSWFD